MCTCVLYDSQKPVSFLRALEFARVFNEQVCQFFSFAGLNRLSIPPLVSANGLDQYATVGMHFLWTKGGAPQRIEAT